MINEKIRMKTNQQIKCEITVAKYKKRRGKKNWWLFSSERMWTTQFEAMGIVPSFKLLFFFLPNSSSSNPAVFFVFENQIKRCTRHTLR